MASLLWPRHLLVVVVTWLALAGCSDSTGVGSGEPAATATVSPSSSSGSDASTPTALASESAVTTAAMGGLYAGPVELETYDGWPEVGGGPPRVAGAGFGALMKVDCMATTCTFEYIGLDPNDYDLYSTVEAEDITLSPTTATARVTDEWDYECRDADGEHVGDARARRQYVFTFSNLSNDGFAELTVSYTVRVEGDCAGVTITTADLSRE